MRFLSAVPAIIYARFRSACMRNRKRLFMGLCANAPATLMRWAFLLGLKIMTITVEERAFLTESIRHMVKVNVLYKVKRVGKG